LRFCDFFGKFAKKRKKKAAKLYLTGFESSLIVSWLLLVDLSGIVMLFGVEERVVKRNGTK
jgi:hypothetical protein